jgi:DNA repair protein RadA/Sms
VASSFKDRPTYPHDVVFGEVGLTGEVRAVSRVEQRVKEAEKLGFRRVILPENNRKGLMLSTSMEIIGVQTVVEALQAALQ